MTSKAARKFMKKHIRHHIRDLGMTQDQAVAAAYSEARKKGYKVKPLRARSKRKRQGMGWWGDSKGHSRAAKKGHRR